MSESKRIALDPQTEIRLCRSPEGHNDGIWTIIGITSGGEGGSSICYEATHHNRHGRLKEFYPGDMSISGRDWLFHFQRTEDHQLQPLGESMTARFCQLCQDYLGAYHMLEKAKSDSPNSQLLNNYMPAYEILYGICADGSPGSVYIWTPDDKQGKNFQDYLSEVRADPDHLPEHKLYNILNTLITLSGCIRVLHEADLLHLDIKPSNFLVLYDGSYNINPFSISLFDVNSLYSIYSDFPRIAGTPGYRAPELSAGEASNTSDIYSIGAMLYHAVVIGSGPELYSDDLYGKLDRLVNGSALLQATDLGSNIYLRHRLVTILKKCLARNPDLRYDCCEDLISDLEEARAYLLPEVFSGDLGMQKKLAILDSESQEDCSPTTVLQEMLYRHPLYQYSPKNDPELRVLVVGTGTYGQLFLDQCLQAGQMLGKTLRIAALSNHPDLDQELYLQSRPALNRFVNVNGSLARLPEAHYGGLDFLPIPGDGEFALDAPGENRTAVRQILSRYLTGGECHYVFIALGDDRLNSQVAAEFAAALGNGKRVHYVLRSRELPADPPADPVLIKRSISAESIDADLDRMGFNTHLCWESTLNLDIPGARRKYENKYNRASSLVYALSIRSKLASVGITETDPVEAARQFQEQIVDRRRGQGAAQEKFNRLVALEHRRWVLEKVTAGWQPIPAPGGKPDYAALARRNMTKDNQAQRHPCLVFSGETTPLHTFTPQMWDTPGEYDAQLDELDRMSVELHRAFAAQANQFLSAQPMKKLELQAIRSKLAGAPDRVIREFERYQLCLKNILEGNQNYTRQYRTYADSFRDTLTELDESLRTEIKARMELIHQAIFAVMEHNQFKDYKKLDEILVEKIPFILTYRVEQKLAMVFEDGRLDNGKNSRVFASVASPTVINPRHITYLYYFDSQSRIPLLVRKAGSVLNYFARRNMRCTVSFCIAFAPEIPLSVREALKAKFAPLSESGKLENVKFLNPQTPEKAVAQFAAQLAERVPDLVDCSVPLFASPRQNQLFLSGAVEPYPSFEFDWKEKRFLDTRDCGYLQYIDDRSYIRIDDMFALMNATDNRHYYPEFADVYMDLWQVYSGSAYMDPAKRYTFYNGANNWNRLCNALEAFTRTNDQVCKFDFRIEEHLPPATHIFYLPDYMYATLDPILTRLKEIGAVLDSSSLTSCNSDTCLLKVCTEHDILAPLETLIDVLYDRADASGFTVDYFVTRNKDRENVKVVMIRCDRLTVDHMSMDNSFNLKVLRALSELHLINQLRVFGEPELGTYQVSFRFTSPRMKKLLTTAGEILEVYTYYDIKKQGYFDDIACSFEFLWESGDITNELDCVLTRGFRSIIVECKSKRELDQDYYYKLSAIADQFGLGTKKVLIANTYDISNAGVVAENALNRTRGKQLGIITISDPKEIRNIGATLRSILEGTYRQDF